MRLGDDEAATTTANLLLYMLPTQGGWRPVMRREVSEHKEMGFVFLTLGG